MNYKNPGRLGRVHLDTTAISQAINSLSSTNLWRRGPGRGGSFFQRCSRLALALFFSLTFISQKSHAANPSAKISSALQPFVESHSLAGAVTLVANKDDILSINCVGYSDVAAQKPMKPDSMFWIASQSKPMTTTAFMMLVDEGKVSVDDPVEKYLPEFKGQMLVAERNGDHVVLKKPSHPILIREILSHTSGLPFSSRPEQPTLDALPLREAVMTYAMSPLEFEPGTKYAYANAGINTAARIIEVVSGMPYEEFMRQRLFKPLGMKDTTFWPTESQERRIAKSYKPNAAKNDLE
ncbi:MAG TPA: serine hydrolase domain-containing protein, partial [Verrucomicrobiae bacterium]|nr:serine hydrolase domain-containing protein [Verrucomicrobiae bacterium]